MKKVYEAPQMLAHLNVKFETSASHGGPGGGPGGPGGGPGHGGPGPGGPGGGGKGKGRH